VATTILKFSLNTNRLDRTIFWTSSLERLIRASSGYPTGHHESQFLPEDVAEDQQDGPHVVLLQALFKDPREVVVNTQVAAQLLEKVGVIAGIGPHLIIFWGI